MLCVKAWVWPVASMKLPAAVQLPGDEHEMAVKLALGLVFCTPAAKVAGTAVLYVVVDAAPALSGRKKSAKPKSKAPAVRMLPDFLMGLSLFGPLGEHGRSFLEKV